MLPPSFTPEFLRRLELLSLRSKRAFLGTRQGGHLSPKRGHGMEFSDYRKYELGDHPRYIDWGVYARSERLYVKRFQEEQDLSVLIILDASASMNAAEDQTKWQRAKELSLALAYVALMQQDNVILAALGHAPGPVYKGLKSIHHLAERLSGLEPVPGINLEKEVMLAASRISFPGVAVFISDFLMPAEEVEKFFTILRSKNLDLTALQILDRSDTNPFQEESFIAIDSETGDEVPISAAPEILAQYDDYLTGHWKRLSGYFVSNNIKAVRLEAESGINELVTNKLSKAGLFR